MLLSRPQEFPVSQLLTVTMQALDHPDQNPISFYLQGSFGYSKKPVAHYGNYDTHKRTCKQNTNAEIECSFCVPGGPGVIQSLLITSLYQEVDDSVVINRVKANGDDCVIEEADFLAGLYSITYWY